MTSNPNYLGQGDHFPHLLASQISSSNHIPARPSKIKIRIRPLTIRFTEAGVNDLNIQVKARIDSKHDIPQQHVSKRDSKGKGKARAVESDVPPQDQDQDDDDLSQLLDDLDDSVRALKAKIRLSIPQTKDRTLRLIHSGRILSDGTRLVSWLDSLDSHRRNQEFKAENGQMGVAAREFVGLVGDGLVGIRKGLEDLTREEQEEEEEGYQEDQDKLSKAKGKGKAREIEDQDDPFESRKNQRKIKIIKDLEENTTYIQCSIGDLIEAKPAGQDKLEEDEEMKTRNGTIDPAPRGFDRLLTAANLTHEEIEEMRARFRASRGIVSSGDALFEDEEAEHTRALEEQWIESLSPQENTSTSNNDTYSTMLEGVLVGFFLPFLPLFFLSDRSSPSSIASPNWNTRNSGNSRDERIAGHHLNNRSSYVFSEEMKQAIVFGLVSNLIFGAFRMMW